MIQAFLHLNKLPAGRGQSLSFPPPRARFHGRSGKEFAPQCCQRVVKPLDAPMVGRVWLLCGLAMACQRRWSARGALGEHLAQTIEGLRRSEASLRSLGDPGIDTQRNAPLQPVCFTLRIWARFNTRENDDRSLVRSSQGPQEREKVRHHPAEFQKKIWCGARGLRSENSRSD